MDDPLLSASRWLLCLSVFTCVFRIFSRKLFFGYQAGTRSEENLLSSMGESGIREPDG